MDELSGSDPTGGPRAMEPRLEEVGAALALSEAEGLGPARLRDPLERFGSPTALLAARRAPELGPDLRRRLAGVRPAPTDRIRALQRRGIRLLAYGSAGYPSRLRQLHDPPILLYVSGVGDLRHRRIAAIVGTRRATPYGRRMARVIATGLVEAGWAIVSGMARGIDGAAHEAALEGGGATIGVLGSGLDFTYPAAHRSLYRRMRRHGALVSEFPPATPPSPGLFPRRNRIIAALADAVVVVQAPRRSGALITVDHALDLGREVLAVPGPVGLEASAGVHRLLREGAAIATSAADVLAAVEGEGGEHAGGTAASVAAGGAAEAGGGHASRTFARRHGCGPVLERLALGPASADDLVRVLSRPVPEALALLGVLELEGILRRGGDGRYVLSDDASAGRATAARERFAAPARIE